MRLALQHLHGLAVADVIEPDTVGRQDLVPHFDAILLGQPTMVHSGERWVWLDKTLTCLPPPWVWGLPPTSLGPLLIDNTLSPGPILKGSPFGH